MDLNNNRLQASALLGGLSFANLGGLAQQPVLMAQPVQNMMSAPFPANHFMPFPNSLMPTPQLFFPQAQPANSAHDNLVATMALQNMLLKSLLQQQQQAPLRTPSPVAMQPVEPSKESLKRAPATKPTTTTAAKRSKPSVDEDDECDTMEHHSGSEESELDKRPDLEGDHMHGERRLNIQFDSLGTRGAVAQGFGRGSCVIPDGLCGRHTLYGESWKFSIKHESVDKEAKLACITWSMTSLATSKTLSRTETLAEARKRELHGRTIANQVVKKALEMRAQELETRLAGETNETWRLHLKGKIDALRPTRFTQGPLAFGLHHRAVQDRMRELLQTQVAQ